MERVGLREVDRESWMERDRWREVDGEMDGERWIEKVG
jgi:hypothetical protein